MRCSAALREALKRYAPHLFSISLFEIAGSKSFDHYAAATVTFVRDKLDTFGGCDVVLHLNTLAAGRTPLLRQLHAAARGRIEFVEVAFTPRKGVAPWLLAASRLVPLLEQRGRTVVSMDVHDDLVLQNTQLVGLLGRLRKEKKELALTFWLAEDGCDDCLIQSPLPVPKLKSYAPEYGGGGGAFGLHAHTDGGMMVAKGEALREDLLAAHGGLGFGEFVGEHVRGAQTIPHGIEEMAFDAYLQQAGWMRIGPRVLFAVHRSLLAGRDGAAPLAAVDATCSAAHALRYERREVDVGKVESGVWLATCRHSHALDCAEDSLAAKARGARGATSSRVYVERGGGEEEEEDDGEDYVGPQDYGWLESGSEWLQRRVATRHGDGVVSVGTLTKWVPADGEDEALWHMAHDDGDGEDLDEAEVEAAMKLYAEVAGEEVAEEARGGA